jgi:hypothetical protein
MPQRINMTLNNGNSLLRRNESIFDANLAYAPVVRATPPSSLNTSIIARIHSVKPGCGSCGKKM